MMVSDFSQRIGRARTRPDTTLQKPLRSRFAYPFASQRLAALVILERLRETVPDRVGHMGRQQKRRLECPVRQPALDSLVAALRMCLTQALTVSAHGRFHWHADLHVPPGFPGLAGPDTCRAVWRMFHSAAVPVRSVTIETPRSRIRTSQRGLKARTQCSTSASSKTRTAIPVELGELASGVDRDCCAGSMLDV